jgi:hypothetical protein
MTGIKLRYLAYLGSTKSPAELHLSPGLNVICGASDTGKSFVVDSIDFMLGQENPVRDIPERQGFDRIRLLIEGEATKPLCLERSVEGGHFRAYEELLFSESPTSPPRALRAKHSASRADTISHVLLERSGLTSRVLRKNAGGELRSLSFRDLARLCVVNEEEIQSRRSPFLSGQYLTATSELAAFKLLLSGTDDSALVAVKESAGRREHDAGKIELLDNMIAELEADLDDAGIEESELQDQLTRLEEAIRAQTAALAAAQKALDEVLERRGAAVKEIRNRGARIAEIDGLIERFALLDRHYESDLARLAAIHESGTLFVHLDQRPCPLCGAMPSAQHLESDCGGNTEAVVQASDAEMQKIARLRAELAETLTALRTERASLNEAIAVFEQAYSAADADLQGIAAPSIAIERTAYNDLVLLRAEVRLKLDKVERLKGLANQRASLAVVKQSLPNDPVSSKTLIPKSLVDEFAKAVEGILQEWHYPNAARVFFDEGKRDLQIAGKDRASSGKGLRAVSHAAITIGLMEFCRDRALPHPGFVVLDSPLLAYWKPEGADDDLRGTDLKERFYEYLLGMNQASQVVVVENEHPPDAVLRDSNVVVFTKNPHQGRYGFFPVT